MNNTSTGVYVFDAYGTLFDVHAAIARHRTAAGPEADRFSEIWRTKQLEYTWTLTLAGHHADFWTLTERALDYALARVPSVDRALRPQLLDAYLKLDPFPDARDALGELKARGARLAILSNGTPRMLAAIVEAAGFAALFDAVFSVEAAGLYKPRPEIYALVTARMAVAPARRRLRLVEPLGRDGRSLLRLHRLLGQPLQSARRIYRFRAVAPDRRSCGAAGRRVLICLPPLIQPSLPIAATSESE